ncbi:MAG: 2-oxoglutarate and iron-dependent oxygenase domain-containing protein [Pseudomonadota bacterium]
MSPEIPLIDLRQWRTGSTAEQNALMHAVDRHLQRVGFLMLRNHGLPALVTNRARAAAHSFFALPATRKQAHTTQAAYRGWIALGLESNASSYDKNDAQADIIDLKEAYSVGPVFPGFAELQTTAPRWYADNIWPDQDIPGFQSALTEWSMCADRLTLELLSILTRALGFAPDWVTEHCDKPMATVTANLYPQVDAQGGWRVGAHTDFGTITLLDRDNDNGLQVNLGDPANEQWVDAPAIADTLTMNLGEMMVLLSAGRWRANPHRVIARPGASANLSLIYFHDPNHDTPLPQNPLGATTAADFLGHKMDQIIQG